MKRREFVNFVGMGLMATSLPVAIAACGSETADTAEDTTEPVADAPAAEAVDSSVRDDGFAALGALVFVYGHGRTVPYPAVEYPAILSE